tara:strand:+ start:975 stop:1250 length:276 start_codon:yes stop_codon:yes gene_type:complete
MTTITLLLAILAIITSVFTLLMSMTTHQELEKELSNIKQGLRECATRSSLNALEISTIDNRTKSKPKAKRGRPKKAKIPPKPMTKPLQKTM